MKLYYPAALPASLFPASRQDFRLHLSAEQAGRHPLTFRQPSPRLLKARTAFRTCARTYVLLLHQNNRIIHSGFLLTLCIS